MKIVDRYKGSLLGMATGDAVGTTNEFLPPGTFTPIEDMVGGGVFNLRAGEWTDDTSMGLCLAESLIECGKFDPIDQLERYVRWWHGGHLSSNGTCFDIGITVRTALAEFEKTSNAYCGPSAPNTAGNGSLMRLAPVPLFFAGDFGNAVFMSGESSRTTHGAQIAVDACRYFAALIVGAINGENKDALLASFYSPTQDFWSEQNLCAEISEIAAGSFKTKNPPEIVGSGYAARSLEAALWCFYNSVDFKSGCLMAANLGNDADTTGAIYGQLAGAFYGVENIPRSWREKIVMRDLIETFAVKLCELAGFDTN